MSENCLNEIKCSLEKRHKSCLFQTIGGNLFHEQISESGGLCYCWLFLSCFECKIPQTLYNEANLHVGNGSDLENMERKLKDHVRIKKVNGEDEGVLKWREK